jgi:hypothetical protein
VYLRTLLGLGRYDEARDLLVEQLRGPGGMRAMMFLQPSNAAFRPAGDAVPPQLMERLRRDRAVRDALKGKGRILDPGEVRLEPIALPPLKPNPPRPLG